MHEVEMHANRQSGWSLRSLWLGSILAGLAIVAASQVVSAANPDFGRISPQGGQVGTEVDVTLTGSRLSDAKEIMLYYPGIKVVDLKADGDKKVTAKLAIAPDCRIGIHAMRIRTASGISDLHTFNVGPLPDVAEKEPNNDLAAPQEVKLDVTINGVVQAEDTDYYVVDAKKGERVTAEIEGIRLGTSFFDPYLAILDQSHKELARSDDAALVWQDGIVSIVAPRDGKYIIQVREIAFGGNGNCFYRLHVGRFPRPMAIVPAGGQPGETVEVRWLGDVLGERKETVKLPSQIEHAFGLLAKDDRGVSPSPNAFRASSLGNVLESEPNDEAAQATGFEAPRALNGVLSKPGDIDSFKFTAKKGQVFDVRVHGRSIRSPIDSLLTITNSKGRTVGNNDDSGGPDSYLRLNVPADDEYTIAIRDHLAEGGSYYAYRIEVGPVEPRLTLGLPERQQYVDVTVSVPQGNRTAFLVSATRTDFGGDLAIEAHDLPSGVAWQTVPMAANQTSVPVLLEAAADAPLAGALANVVGRSLDPKVKVEGHLEQDTMLVRGQNNRKVWGHLADRMALAVTEEVPYTIEVVQPKVPLVRNGSMNLKVVAKRKEGFTAPIAVRMLYNPPGVGSAGSVSIPEGKNEAEIPLNANSGAEMKTWKIAVMGQATVGDGPVLVSSQLADLEIADAFFTLAFRAAAVEQGDETTMVATVTKNKDFDGKAKLELVGLPNEATAEPVEIDKETTELTFKVKTTKASPAGRHKSILCRAVVMANGEPITHSLGPGELRIDTPLPAKSNAKAASKPAAKSLSRLEQLRQQRDAADAQTAAAPK
jgi:hypothetical protein